MSMFSCATMLSSGTVGCSVKYCDPYSPTSSAVCQTKSSERRGFLGREAKYCAISSIPAVPDASSSAPLNTESSRAGPSARARASSARKAARFSSVHAAGSCSSPSGRRMRLKASSESWSTASRVTPTWSLWEPMATYCPRSAGSLPGRTATTLRAGNSIGRSKNAAEPLTVRPAAPTCALASGVPSRRSATAVLMMSPGGKRRGSGAAWAPASSVRGSRKKPASPGEV
jgi:hypothetical protein